MSRVTTTNYLGSVDTTFQWATDDNDPFDRNDISNVAQALEQHTHVAGKGLQVQAGGLANSSVTSTALAAGAVGTAAVADDAITAAKIAPDAVGASEIAAGAVGPTELADDAVTAAKIAADAVGASEIAALAVGTAEIADLGVTNGKLAADAVTPSKVDNTGIYSMQGLNLGTNGLASIGPISPLRYDGGTTAAGDPSFRGLNVGTDGIASAGPITALYYAGGSLAVGVPSFLGLNLGTSGLVITGGPCTCPSLHVTSNATVDGSVTAGAYAGGSTATGSPSLKGVTLGSDGIASTGPIRIGGQDVYYPGNPPPLGSGSAVPSKLIAMFPTAADIAVGWNRCNGTNSTPNMDGRIAVGAGTTFSKAFTENTAYGSSWSATPAGSVAVVITSHTSVKTDAQINSGGAEHVEQDHSHAITSQTFTGTAFNVWDSMALHAIVYAQKS